MLLRLVDKQMKFATGLSGLSPRRSLRQFGKYAVVGGLGTATDFAVTIFLIEQAGVPVLIAGTCGFAAAVVQNFLLNRLWTFPGSDHYNTRGQMVRFALVSLGGLAIHLFLFALVDKTLMPYWTTWLGSAERAFALSYRFAKLCAISVTLIWNYTANRMWTFKSHEQAISS